MENFTNERTSFMPIGVIINGLSVAVGGFLGAKFGKIISQDLKEKLNLVFGLCSMTIGISSIILIENLPPVILSLILGTIAGSLLRIGTRIERAGAGLSNLFSGHERSETGNNNALMVTAIVLFCASGTGIFGTIVSGMSGDHSILIAKSVLDLFTAMIFACSLGLSVSAIAIPQTIFFLLLFFSAKLIYPLTTPSMINDFKACGGIILLATGFRITKIRDFPIADMIPSMILVWFTSYAWTAWIVPMLIR